MKPSNLRVMKTALIVCIVLILPGFQLQAQDYCDDGGLIVVEFENLPITNNGGTYHYKYKDGSGPDPEVDFGGYTGDLYMTYYGPTDLHDYSAPGTGVMTLAIDVTDAGQYECKIRNRHPSGPVSGENNDIWMRVNGSGWQKLYSGTYNQWNWVTREDHHSSPHTDCLWNLNAGANTIEFSGRSDKFSIDRVHIGKNVGSRLTDSSEPETLCPDPPPPTGSGENEDDDDDSSDDGSGETNDDSEDSDVEVSQSNVDDTGFEVDSGCGAIGAQIDGNLFILLMMLSFLLALRRLN
jgi:hypothetical protein